MSFLDFIILVPVLPFTTTRGPPKRKLPIGELLLVNARQLACEPVKGGLELGEVVVTDGSYDFPRLGGFVVELDKAVDVVLRLRAAIDEHIREEIVVEVVGSDSKG